MRLYSVFVLMVNIIDKIEPLSCCVGTLLTCCAPPLPSPALCDTCHLPPVVCLGQPQEVHLEFSGVARGVLGVAEYDQWYF